jgi:hypothetical protein
MGRHLFVVLGTSIQAGWSALLEETKICSKEEEMMVWDGWLRRVA